MLILYIDLVIFLNHPRNARNLCSKPINHYFCNGTVCEKFIKVIFRVYYLSKLLFIKRRNCHKPI